MGYNLFTRYPQSTAPKFFELWQKISMCQQESLSIKVYYTKFCCLWDELTNLIHIPKCICDVSCSCGSSKLQDEYELMLKLTAFLMGLNDKYTEIRGQILRTSPLPSIARAASILIQEENQLKFVPSPSSSSSTEDVSTTYGLSAGEYSTLLCLTSKARLPLPSAWMGSPVLSKQPLSNLDGGEVDNKHVQSLAEAVEALKVSRMELKKLVHDPLPSALRVADGIRFKMAQVYVGETSSSHSPSPAKKKKTPAKKKKTPRLRRKVNQWTPLEETTLIDAVERIGLGQWAYILEQYSDIFDRGRTSGDLRDKWRNLTRKRN